MLSRYRKKLLASRQSNEPIAEHSENNKESPGPVRFVGCRRVVKEGSADLMIRAGQA
jgi:hypothetical protein